MPGKHQDADDPLARALAPPPDESLEDRAAREAKEQEAVRISNAIDESIKAEKLAEKKKRMVKLLLLGQSESGEVPTHPFHIISPIISFRMQGNLPHFANFSSIIHPRLFAKRKSYGGRLSSSTWSAPSSLSSMPLKTLNLNPSPALSNPAMILPVMIPCFSAMTLRSSRPASIRYGTSRRYLSPR